MRRCNVENLRGDVCQPLEVGVNLNRPNMVSKLDDLISDPASTTLRYSVEVVTNKTMQKPTMQSVKFSIGTWENKGAIFQKPNPPKTNMTMENLRGGERKPV